MALSLMLGKTGYEPEHLHTEAEMQLDSYELAIARIELTAEGRVPDINGDAFREHAAEAKEGSPVSKALAGTRSNWSRRASNDLI